jgi:hypothetical protein
LQSLHLFQPGVGLGCGFGLRLFLRFCRVGHELVDACGLPPGGFEGVSVLEGFREGLVCLFAWVSSAVIRAVSSVTAASFSALTLSRSATSSEISSPRSFFSCAQTASAAACR